MRLRRVILALPLLCLGCAQTDPYLRPDLWAPDGAPQADLAAQVADPHDLIAGHGAAAPAQYGPQGVQRIWADHPKALLTTTDATTGSGSSSGSGSGTVGSGN